MNLINITYKLTNFNLKLINMIKQKGHFVKNEKKNEKKKGHIS